MKRLFFFLLKTAVSGILAVVILSVICLVYDNAPVVIEQPLNITNSRFEPDNFWSCMTEGFGFGRINNIGYSDTQDLTSYQEPVIACLGSSHTAAFQVPQGKNYVSVLQKNLLNDVESGNDYQCLNLGVNTHYLSVSVSNLDYVTAGLENIQYLVIETPTIAYSPAELDAMCDGKYHDPLSKQGLFSRLLVKYPVLRVPFLRSVKKQLDRINRIDDANPKQHAVSAADYDGYEHSLCRVLEKVSASASLNGFEALILYHNSLSFDDGTGLRRTDDPQIVRIFRETCNQYGVHFIDVADSFIRHYDSTYQTSYGFMNTAMGEGHLNTIGHGIIADALYQKICEIEKEKADGI